MNLLLISPRWGGLGNRIKIKVREREVHPLTLGVIAALSPGHRIRIVDEHLEPLPLDDPFDLVGITCATHQAPRAYRICAEFRARGVPTVLGGVHPTLVPEEALQHAEAVVTGEAESVWGQVLDDATAGRLQRVYCGGTTPDLSVVPVPRRDLFANHRAAAAYVQATRGCGGQCSFCYLQHVGWGIHRQRPIGAVVDELRRLPQRFVLFVDDNLWAERAYALELMRALQPLRKQWWAQAPVSVGEDDELVRAASQAGCFALSLGLQSISRSAIAEAQVANRVESYRDAIANLQRHRIMVDGTFIFGFDSDPPTIFADTAEAVSDMGLDAATYYLLTAYPGTPAFRQLDREGRIVDHDWAHYDWDHAVLRPAQMTTDELTEGVAWAYRKAQRHPLRWAGRHLRRHGRKLLRSPRLALFLLRQNWPQRYHLGY